MASTQIGSIVPFDLAAILYPLSVRDFIDTCWSKQFTYIAGEPGKFSGLYGWQDLNDLLALTRMPSPRLRLIKKNQDIDAARYRTRSALPGRGSLLNPKAFLSELAEGATLIIDEIDDTSRALRILMASLEERFRVRVHANLYAGWGGDNGFPVHWDPHGTLILHLFGRKHWLIWPPTRKYPLKRDTDTAVPPTADPVFDAHLTDGSALYIPRGWWHVAYPLNEPCLHVTVTINTLVGEDLLKFVLHRARSSDVIRQDLPQLTCDEDQNAYLARLRQAINNAWSADIIEECLLSRACGHAVRSDFRLPELTVSHGAVTHTGSRPTEETTAR